MSSGMDSRNFTGESVAPARATEETKPEREAFDEFARTELAEWLSPYSEDLKEYMGEIMQASWKSWQASADAALERAAQLVETRGAARRDMYDLIGDEHAAGIRALKGRK